MFDVAVLLVHVNCSVQVVKLYLHTFIRYYDSGHKAVAKSKVYHVISKRRIVFRFHGGKIVALMTENIMREISNIAETPRVSATKLRNFWRCSERRFACARRYCP